LLVAAALLAAFRPLRRICGSAEAPHGLDDALYAYARRLSPRNSLNLHPLGADAYTASTRGGAGERRSSARSWASYKTWADLQRNPTALHEYSVVRAAALRHPDFDWSRVMREVAPLLNDSREHIGVIGVGPDGRTLRVLQREASPTSIGDSDHHARIASVPPALVEKYADMVALYIFHTHPDADGVGILPSACDVVCALNLSLENRFAGSVVISGGGIFVYGLAWTGYRLVMSADDQVLASLNLTYDLVCAVESMTSATAHKIIDVVQNLARHHIDMIVYPTPKCVANDYMTDSGMWVDRIVDYDLINDVYRDIVRHVRHVANVPKAAHKLTHAEMQQRVDRLGLV
jgi:hypothetical protein